jgi:NodT family efflux transporter outer membrane factor (OMF) lipoprotein
MTMRSRQPLMPRGAALLTGCLILSSGSPALLGGCAVGPDFVRPAAPAATGYTREAQAAATIAADGVAQGFSADTELPAEWWRLFKSAPLDATVQRALVNSPTLQAAEASLRQSRDNLRAGDGLFYPQTDAGLGATRARSAPAQDGSSSPGSVFNVATASGGIAYVLDVFGGERRAVEGLGAQVEVQRFAGKAAYLTLSANVVDTCIARAAYVAQARATEELIELETDQLRSIEAQVRAGASPYANLLSQRSLISANQALLAPLQQKISQAGHLLALLGGDLPGQATLPDIELGSLALPTDLPLSLPSDLVRQRPDILSAEAQLHAASAEIGVATAALFPSFSLSATYGAAGSSLGKLFGAAGRFWSVGPSLTAPLLHGGSLRAQRQAAIDAFDVQQAHYRQAVLSAFGEVADALKALEHDARSLQAQGDAQRAAAEALGLLQANYRAGLVAYIDVLGADVQLHTAAIARLQAVAQRHQDTVALFVALGGGWWNAPGVVAGSAKSSHATSAGAPP